MKQTPTNCGKFEDEPGMRGHCKNCGGTYHEHYSGKVAVQQTDMKTERYRVLTSAGNILYQGDTYVALIHRGNAQSIADNFNTLIDERDAALLKLEQIREYLWPEGDKEHQWTAETLEDIAEVLDAQSADHDADPGMKGGVS